MINARSRFHRASAAALITAAACLVACDSAPSPRAGHPALDPRDRIVQNVYPALQDTVGQYAILVDSLPLRVEGYGIVAELNGTGSGDMPPTVREALTDMLYTAGAGSYIHGTEDINPEKILRSNLIAAVEVRGIIPPLAKRGDSFDLVVNCLPDSQATSLSGGLLWTSELKVVGLTADTHNDTHPIAMGRGPVFLSAPVESIVGDPAAKEPANTRRAARVGRIIGGGRVAEDRAVRLQLLSPSGMIANAIDRAINARFPGRDKAAVAESDSTVTLHVPPEFGENPSEFVEIVRHMYLRQEAPGFSEHKAAELIADLKDPAAPHKDLSLALQALGRSVLPDYIQPQYTASDPRLRFWCARAGAGLQDVGGMVVLQEFARQPNSPFQKDALASITLLSRGGDTERATATLFAQLKSTSIADRIAAYQGLTAIHSSLIRSYGAGRKFVLDILPCDGPPIIYATQSGAPRIALIGPPITLAAGLLYVSNDHALTVNVPEAADSPAASADGLVPTVLASAGADDSSIKNQKSKTENDNAADPAPSGDPASKNQKSTIKNDVTLYWLPTGGRPPVDVKTSARLPDVIARLAWIPDPAGPKNETPYIGASYQRIAEMLASLCHDRLIDAQFALQNLPDDGLRTPIDLINTARPEGFAHQPPGPPASAPSAPPAPAAPAAFPAVSPPAP